MGLVTQNSSGNVVAEGRSWCHGVMDIALGEFMALEAFIAKKANMTTGHIIFCDNTML